MADSVSFNGQTVTFTGSNVLSSAIVGDNLTGMTHVIIEGYSSIGNNAFQDASGLTSITIPEGVTSIGEFAFNGTTSLTSIEIPASVTNIGFFAFIHGSSLTEFTVDLSNNNYKDISGVLFDFSGETLINYPLGNTTTTYEIPTSVTTIGNNAFQNATYLNSVTIQEGVKSIGERAFQGAIALSDIIIPSTVDSIANYVFQHTTLLESITVDLSNNNYKDISGVLFNKNGETLIQYPIGNTITTYETPSGTLSIERNAFEEATYLTSITIRAGLTTIGNNAFLNANNLQTVNIANNQVTDILSPGQNISFFGKTVNTLLPIYVTFSNGGETITFTGTGDLSGATAQLNGATTVIVEGYSSIGNNAFQDANGLTSITIPSSVTSIGTNVFSGTSSLTNIVVALSNNNYKHIDGVLFNKTGDTLLHYPGNNPRVVYTVLLTVTSIVSNAFETSVNLQKVMIANDHLDITSPATSVEFFGTSVETILPGDIVTINGETITFTGTGTLTSAITSQLGGQVNVFIEGYNTIGTNAFAGKEMLSVTIPASVTVIKTSAFNGAKSLNTVNIQENNIVSIETGAFANTWNLTSFTIPDTIDELGFYIFKQSGLETIIFEENVSLENIPNETFAGTKLNTFTLPASVTSIGASAFQNTTTLTSFIIPYDSLLTSIGSQVFTGTQITNVLYIQNNTTLLYYPPLLTDTSFTIPEIVTSIGSSAFENVSRLTSITISANVTSIGANAFKNATGLTFITIPAKVTSIGANAFYQATSLETVTFETGSQLTSIGNNAFVSSGLTSIDIPASVTSIGASAFNGVSNLTSISVDQSNTVYKDINGVLFNYSGETLIQYPLGNNTVTTYEIPEGAVSISTEAFKYNNINSPVYLKYITLPSTMKNVGTSLMYLLNLIGITVDQSNTSYKDISNVLFDSQGTILIQYPPNNTRTTYEIPTSVTTIPAYAFQYASSLTSISLPDSVTKIEEKAFQSTTDLTSFITTADSQLTWIANNAFLNSGVTEVIITNGRVGIESPGTDKSFFGTTVKTSLPILLSKQAQADISNSIPTDLDITAEQIEVNVGSEILTGGNETEKSQKRTLFLKDFFETYPALDNNDKKVTMTRSELMGNNNSTITKSTMVIKKATNLDTPQETSSLGVDEAIYTFMDVNDYTVYSTSAGNLKIKKTAETQYEIYENFDSNTNTLTKTMATGEASSYGTFIYVVGGVAGEIGDENGGGAGAGAGSGSSGAMVPICFPAGTPVMTNKGEIAIDKLNPDVHTIRGKSIVAITETSPLFKYIIRIEKDALGKNVPCRRTEISRDHEVFYKGKMMRSEDLVEKCEGVYRIKYERETLYNVLMEKHDKMMINNLICETLDPNNIMAKICGGKYTNAERKKLYKDLNNALTQNDLNACKKLYASLK